MEDYLPLLFTFVLALVFALGSIVTVRFVAPRRPTAAKSAPYESGIVPTREPPSRFPVRFYLVAMIFIVFDIEIIFFFPWAVIYRELAAFGLFAVLIFAVAVFESFVYLISQGALDWGPLKKEHTISPMVSADRTSESTIKRVGLEGRDPVEDAAA